MKTPASSASLTGSRRGPADGILLAVILAGLLALFHFNGNTADIRLFSRSVFRWMVMRWTDSTFLVGEYSHGWLIPLVSAWALWRRRRDLRVQETATFWPALGLVALGFAMHWVGMRAQQPRLSLGAFLLLLWSIPCFLYGWRVGRVLLFPCGYLVFCIPLNFFDSFSFQLRILATSISAGVLNGLGIAVVRSGSSLHAVSGAFAFEVADPCSGIRSLLAMTALTAAYGYFTPGRLWARLVLFASAVPLAVAGNIARVLSIALVARFAGQERAMGFYHEYSGYVVFAVAVVLLMALDAMLARGRKAM